MPLPIAKRLPYYELWEMQTGNAIHGSYDLAEMIDLVRGVLEEWPPEWIDSWVLLKVTDYNAVDKAIAEGPDLVALAYPC